MSADYELGTIAVATVRGVPNVRVMRLEGSGWVSGEPVAGTKIHRDEPTDVRPLVVLDLVDAPDTARTLRRLVPDLGMFPAGKLAELADQIEAQTRPPKPPEPQGLGAVVEDSAGRLFVRTASDVIPWLDADDTENGYDYADLDAARVLSEGVTA